MKRANPAPSASTVLLLSISCLTFGACSLKQRAPADPTSGLEALRRDIRAQVDDAGRQQSMLAAVDRMEVSIRELGRLVASHRQELAVMLLDYDCSRVDLEAAFAGYLEQRRAAVEELAAAHYDLKRAAGPGDWARLVEREQQLLAWAAAHSLASPPLPDASAGGEGGP